MEYAEGIYKFYQMVNLAVTKYGGRNNPIYFTPMVSYN